MNDKQYKKLEKIKDNFLVKRSNLGKAGEFLVAGKLLLNGFNVYIGAIDDGIDLVAKKRKRFYYIQVKTCQDIGYDSGKYIARVNFSSLSKFPAKQTFVVLVLHYLGPMLSPDNIGDHNTYDQMFIVLPLQKLIDFFKKTEGDVSFNVYLSLIRDNPDRNEGWIVKLRSGRKDMILDEFLIDSFWQIEI